VPALRWDERGFAEALHGEERRGKGYGRSRGMSNTSFFSL
jgi:hypothetical protein